MTVFLATRWCTAVAPRMSFSRDLTRVLASSISLQTIIFRDRKASYRLCIMDSSDSIGIIAQHLQTSTARVTFHLGAGISLAATGFPDYAEPGGLFETLRPELLTATKEQRKMMRNNPTYIISMELFEQNQLPFLEVLRPMILSLAAQQWRPTFAHRFLQVLHEKGTTHASHYYVQSLLILTLFRMQGLHCYCTAAGLLEQVFTCNVDGLDHQLGLPGDKIFEVHGTMKRIQCEFCKHEMLWDEFVVLVRFNIKDISANDADAPAESKVILCPNPKCGRAGMKPAVVLYGTKVDTAVAKRMRKHLPRTNTLFAVGTSLDVKPISELAKQCLHAVRVVVNQHPSLMCDFKFRKGRDHLLQGECDEMFVALAGRLGWLHDLARFRDEWCPNSQEMFDAELQATST
jgi:NAD-dependent SIR2 family protein deacetylase